MYEWWTAFWSAMTAVGTIVAATAGAIGYWVVRRERVQQQRVEKGLALGSLWFQCTLLLCSLETTDGAPSTNLTPWTALERAQPYLDQTDEEICGAVRELYKALQYRDIRVQRYLTRSQQTEPMPEGLWAAHLTDINGRVLLHVDYVTVLLVSYIRRNFHKTLEPLDALYRE